MVLYKMDKPKYISVSFLKGIADVEYRKLFDEEPPEFKLEIDSRKLGSGYFRFSNNGDIPRIMMTDVYIRGTSMENIIGTIQHELIHLHLFVNDIPYDDDSYQFIDMSREKGVSIGVRQHIRPWLLYCDCGEWRYKTRPTRHEGRKHLPCGALLRVKYEELIRDEDQNEKA